MGCCGENSRVDSATDINGRRIPHNLENFEGPCRERYCRDVLFLLLFAVFTAFLAYVLASAVMKGNPERLMFGYDDYGNVCGKKNKAIEGATKSGQDLSDKPYLISCSKDVPECSGKRQCMHSCPAGYNATVFRWCLHPQPHVTLLEQTVDVTKNFFEAIISDITRSYPEILILCFISFGLSCIVMVVFRFFAGIIIWLMLMAMSLGFLAGTAYLWYRWHIENSRLQYGTADDLRNEDKKQEIKYWMVGAICASVFTLMFLLVVLVMRKRIQLVAALFGEAGKAIGAMPLLLIQPVWTFLILAALIAGWVVGLVYIQSAGDAIVDNEDKVTFQLSQFFEGMKWYHLMALFWCSNFIMACQHVLIAGAVASWFFTRDKSRLESPICTNLYYLVRYHLGSVALGSLLVALVQIVRALLKFLERQLKKYSDACSGAIKCCSCCLWIFEKFLVFLNRNAYIEIAIYGYSFCKSAQEAFRLLSANVLRVAAINSVGDFLLFLSKVGISAATAFIGYELLKDKEELHYIWVPVAISSGFAYLICHCFLSVYEMAIDTLFLCFCEDCERNNGDNKPFYMSKNLMAFVEKSKKAGYQRKPKKIKDASHGA